MYLGTLVMHMHSPSYAVSKVQVRRKHTYLDGNEEFHFALLVYVICNFGASTLASTHNHTTAKNVWRRKDVLQTYLS